MHKNTDFIVFMTALVEKLEQAGIHGTVVGKTTGEKARILRNNGEIRYLDRPQADELYRALRQ